MLDVDPTSLRVREGTGGMQPLGADDKANIETTIDDEVLKGQAIAFRSSEVQPASGGSRLSVRGDLTLLGETRPIAFDLLIGDGTLRSSVVVKQTEWGITPYSALFGALKVSDEVEVESGRRAAPACAAPASSYERIRPCGLKPALLELGGSRVLRSKRTTQLTRRT